MTAHIPVREAMTPDPATIDGRATARDALALMRDRGISSLIIDRRHDGDEYGILVVADIVREVIGRNRSLDRTNVYEIMSKPVVTVDAAMDIRYALRLMERLGLSRCLVTEHGRMVGIVTMRELAMRSLDAARDVL